MIGSPGKIAKARYQDAFDSDIFAAPVATSTKHYPPGYRRDQMTSELFGDDVFYKDLRKQEGTFEPRTDPLSPRRKKLQFLQGGTVPETNQQDLDSLPVQAGHSRTQVGFTDDTDHIDHGSDPVVRRHQELESHIFPTHASVDANRTKIRYNAEKITPNSFSWFNSQPIAKPPKDDGASGVSSADRAYAEQASHLFEHAPLPAPSNAQKREQHMTALAQETDDLNKRRANIYYSDLFGRETPASGHLGAYHPKPVSSPESKICIHGEWSDSRTNAKSDERPMTAKERQFRELYRTEVPEQGAKDYRPGDLPNSLSTDTSGKVKRVDEHEAGSRVHQKHLKSSLVRDTFYERAEATRQWEVAEVSVARLAPTEDEGSIKTKCRGFGCHIVKVILDLDPISNMCKGRGKLILRYNPDENDLSGLIDKIQHHLGWQVLFLGDDQ
mmetsp:Transcript_14225/g.35291  ORF Transcript_14225/g.35291 Transcript_14225/m.35291 type:complete len:441 (-) Transcript_14225:266-1588(-)|eukprot:CAMPEP_0178998692 /NCGR_PEP_ID=MMETSP0795-20121207/9647_1 /TAXON_ID=88552 /ORGANISM="Amoebophrya sp., Strain Ameob2" /LENGTH=440 /DNA_ID=CAMNT_0020691385 /DNA_START=325 /DNA_END=1647 /DNA_ORIENTATION=-